MVTIFSIPKAFEGLAATQQRNAIASWQALPCDKQVILLGADEGVAEAAAELGCLHVANLRMSVYGTPYLDSAFTHARDRATYDLMCYCNADIILFGDFVEGVVAGARAGTLMTGRRHELEVAESLGPITDQAMDSLQHKALQQGELDSVHGMDYFAYQKGEVDPMLPFIVGRPWWDNWMVGNALYKGMRVVDATGAITAVHQKHAYAHVPARAGRKWEGPEGDANRKLLGVMPKCTTLHASHIIANKEVVPNLKWEALDARLKWMAHCLYYYRDQISRSFRYRYRVAVKLMKLRKRKDSQLIKRTIYSMSRPPRIKPDDHG